MTNHLTVEEAHAAIERCKFVVPDYGDPGQRDAGREIVHCFLSSIGADWDAFAAKAACDQATAIGWADTLFGRCLCVVVDEPDRRRIYHFDTVTPE